MSCSVCAGYSDYNCPCCGERTHMSACHKCNGVGRIYEIVNLKTSVIVSVDWPTYLAYPDNEDEAIERGKDYCKYDEYRCPACDGEGEILEDD